MPCYNGAKFICQAIESALAQSHPAIEVVVVDDGSTDGSVEAINNFGGAVRLIRQSNRGVAAARNTAIDNASGTFIAFLDQDDFWDPLKIEKQIAAFERDPSLALVHTEAKYIDAADRVLTRENVPGRKAIGHCFVDLLQHNTIVMSSVLLRRDALGELRFGSGVDGCDDWDLWLQICRHRPVALLDEALTTIRIHAANVSHNRSWMLRADLGVIERVLGRETAPDIVALARAQYRGTLSALAHVEFENGNAAAARALFIRQGGPRSFADVVRFAATLMPPPVRRCIQYLYRSAKVHLAS
jgi:glycosyltransferase involved in cell wall biosynthesis